MTAGGGDRRGDHNMRRMRCGGKIGGNIAGGWQTSDIAVFEVADYLEFPYYLE